MVSTILRTSSRFAVTSDRKLKGVVDLAAICKRTREPEADMNASTPSSLTPLHETSEPCPCRESLE